MTDAERSLCDCPEPCACYAEGYAAGKDKAHFEVITSLEGPPHDEGCACQPCQVKLRLPALPGQAGLRPEDHDADGQELARAVRAGRGLGTGGP